VESLELQSFSCSINMSQKRPWPTNDPLPKPQPTPNVEETKEAAPEASQSVGARKSWVWKYFQPEPKLDKVRCTAIMKKNGNPCNTLLAQDQTGSTKSMSEHLFRIHHILDPNKVETSLHNIELMIKSQKKQTR
jgi:hypothetical protein